MPRPPRPPRRPGGAAWWRLPAVGPAVAVVLAAALLVLPALGVGRERTAPPRVVRPSPPRAFVVQNVGLGTLLDLPGEPWSRRGCDERTPPAPEQPHLYCVVSSGAAVLSVWIYPRGQRGPRGAAALSRAQLALVAAAKARPGRFTLTKAAVTRYDGLPAIQLRGDARILGRPRTIRSTHLFVGGREIVVDAYAPGSAFRRIDETVFRPVLRSLRVAPDWRRTREQDAVPAG